MLLFIIFFVGLLTGDMGWAFKVAGVYILALVLVEMLFWMMCLGFVGALFAILL